MSTFNDLPPDLPSAPPPRPGMSGTKKLVLILVGLGGFCLLLCCGGIGLVAWQLSHSTSTDPAVVRKTTEEIIDIKIPEKYTPTASVNIFSFFPLMKVVVYSAPQKEGMLMLMEFAKVFSDREQQAQMKERMNEQHGPKNQKELSTEDKEVEIDGKKVTFKFAKTEDTSSHKKFEQITGVLTGKGGTAMLMISVPEEDYDEDEVLEILKSIR